MLIFVSVEQPCFNLVWIGNRFISIFSAEKFFNEMFWRRQRAKQCSRICQNQRRLHEKICVANMQHEQLLGGSQNLHINCVQRIGTARWQRSPRPVGSQKSILRIAPANQIKRNRNCICGSGQKNSICVSRPTGRLKNARWKCSFKFRNVHGNFRQPLCRQLICAVGVKQ